MPVDQSFLPTVRRILLDLFIKHYVTTYQEDPTYLDQHSRIPYQSFITRKNVDLFIYFLTTLLEEANSGVNLLEILLLETTIIVYGNSYGNSQIHVLEDLKEIMFAS